MVLMGKVIKGKGTAKYWVSKVSEVFLKKTNMKLFLGTLNIKLDKEYLVVPDFKIGKEEYGGTENVLVKKCKFFDRDAYIVRAEKNQKGTGDYSLDIIEIASDINLREKYKLENGMNVKVEFCRKMR